MQNPFEFIQEVRAEGSKVTWPTRRETLITTAMVFVFVVITSMFFFTTDQILRHLMSAFLNFLR
jgi:preprotein translocase subunit SecE